MDLQDKRERAVKEQNIEGWMCAPLIPIAMEVAKALLAEFTKDSILFSASFSLSILQFLAHDSGHLLNSCSSFFQIMKRNIWLHPPHRGGLPIWRVTDWGVMSLAKFMVPCCFRLVGRSKQENNVGRKKTIVDRQMMVRWSMILLSHYQHPNRNTLKT